MRPEEMTYQPGDRVRVVADLQYNTSYECEDAVKRIRASSDMVAKWAGREATIRASAAGMSKCGYTLQEDDSGANNGIGWLFAVSMLEPIDKISLSDVSVSDLMEVLNGAV